MTETIIPSMNLRFVWKQEIDGHSFGMATFRKTKALQQMFTTSKGQEWRDVPLVKPEATIGG